MSENPEESGKDREALEELAEVFSKFIEPFRPAGEKDYECHFTTLAIFNQLQEIYPSDVYDAIHVYTLLIDSGYMFVDITGCGRFEWLMKRR